MSEVHSGQLTVKIKGLLKNKKYNNAWCVLLTGRGQHPARFDIYDSKEESQKPEHCKKSIYLENSKWVATDGLGSYFAINVKGKHCIFIPPTDKDCETWVSTICCVSVELYDTRQTVYTSLGITPSDEFVVQHNEIYETMPNNFSGTMFAVVPESSDDTKRLKLDGNYNLVIAPQSFRLCRCNSNTADYEWDYRHLRDFGHSKNVFFFKSGSRSTTGPGYFGFLTSQGERIVQVTQSTIEQMKDGNDNNVTKSKVRGPPPQPLAKPVLRNTTSVESSSSMNSPSSRNSSECDKKERKRLEQEEKKKKKKEEEEKKKALKKDKKSKPKSAPNPINEAVYSEPDICYKAASAAKPVNPKLYENMNVNADFSEGQVYSEPWENRPIPGLAMESDDYVDDNPENMYACAEPVRGRNITPQVDPEYEDVNNDYAPPVIPPKQYDEEEQDSDLYDCLNGPIISTVPPQENIYGMASATPLGKDL